MKGWISLHREIQDHWLWTEKRQFSKLEAWLDILLNVNHSEQKTTIKNTLFTVKRGESIKSLETWAYRWNWNKSKVRRFFKMLESDSMIVTKNEHKTTRLTVCNYESYQDVRNANETQMKRKGNADETETTPNNNDKQSNNKTIKQDINTRKAEFKNSLLPFLDEYGKDFLNDFFGYWSEHGDRDRKMRFEKEKSFGLSRRLSTWLKNKKRFEKEKSSAKKEKVNAGEIIKQRYGLS